ncbi:hypothetical protein CDAR_393541 [Caerostris darwini]|uniref:Uncharacterized protein n=1 Tax=Caerostris darwini TaxID=1538125 RepID=A0AAV4W8Q0_9ARAC|nr:hypothetical protein CDAR_393541 [Caerostris darwini]
MVKDRKQTQCLAQLLIMPIVSSRKQNTKVDTDSNQRTISCWHQNAAVDSTADRRAFEMRLPESLCDAVGERRLAGFGFRWISWWLP